MSFAAKLRKLFSGSQKPRKKPRALPQRVLAPVEEIVEQGMLVADVAVKMSVKNEIIMNALKHKNDYNPSEVRNLVKRAVIDLRAEREADAKRVEQMLEEIKRNGYSAISETEFGTQDSATLRHRGAVYHGVAKQLADRLEDHEYLKSRADKAWELAWGEISESLKNRASHPYYGGGKTTEYARERRDRIQELIETDIAALLNPQKQQPQKSNTADGEKDASAGTKRGFFRRIFRSR